MTPITPHLPAEFTPWDRWGLSDECGAWRAANMTGKTMAGTYDALSAAKLAVSLGEAEERNTRHGWEVRRKGTA